MKSTNLLVAALSVTALTACSKDAKYENTSPVTPTALAMIVNARSTPIDVLLDGTTVKSALPAGTVTGVDALAGDHSLVLRETGTAAGVSIAYKAVVSAHRSFAALSGTNGALVATTLDDTNSVVPAGATKVRVLHLAQNAGEIQVYRTQPDYPTPIRRQFPFMYNAAPTSLNAPYLQSIVGTWEIRAWQTPASDAGWDTAPIKVTLSLLSGQRRTIVILDKPGGGIRAEQID